MPRLFGLLVRSGAIALLLCQLPNLACCFQTTARWRRRPIAIPRYDHCGGLPRTTSARYASGDGPSVSHGGSDSIGLNSNTVESNDAPTATMVGETTTSQADTGTVLETSESFDSSPSSSPSDHGGSDSTRTQVEHDTLATFPKKDLFVRNSTAPMLERRPSAINNDVDDKSLHEAGVVSRREAMGRTAAILFAGTLIGGGTLKYGFDKLQASSRPIANLNYTRIIKESSIDIVVDGPMNRELINSQTFQKVQTVKLPGWVPSFLVPPPKVIHDVTNIELLTAAAVAGSIVEMARTSLLYPLLTLKTRVQADVNVKMRKLGGGVREPLKIKERMQVTQKVASKHIREGNLYAGLLPSLLISVPATGVYFGVRDVVVHKLIPYTDALGGSISVALLAALVADIISLVIRTPADLLAVRLQAATGEEFEWEEAQGRNVTEAERQAYLQRKIGDWFLESLERLPAVILTDLPFLLSRIALNRFLLQGGPVSLGRYEGIVLFSAILCGLLTTPFDVARTRILVDSDDDPTNGIDGGSGEGLIRTLETIKNEGDGGYRNLFAGWLERVAYLGIGRAWIEPLQILGYLAIRDFILLEWF